VTLNCPGWGYDPSKHQGQ